MKAREIVRQFIWNHGYRRAIVASDGPDYGESGRPFTPKQLEKLEAMRKSIKESTLKKWENISKPERRDIAPVVDTPSERTHTSSSD